MKTPKFEADVGAGLALLETRSFVWADLYTFLLVGGGVLRFAKGDTDWTWGGNTWAHAGPLFEHPDRKPTAHWKRGLDVDVWQFSVMPRPFDLLTGASFPDQIGNVGMLASVRAGALDGAIVLVDRAYLPSWPPFPRPIALTPVAVYNVFTGRVATIEPDRSSVMIDLNSHLELLDQPMPRNLYQAGCGHVLFDNGCTLNAASYATSFSADASSTKSLIAVAGSAPSGSGTYALGRVLFTTGKNAGYSRSIRTMTVAGSQLQLQLVAPMPFPVTAGDGLTAWPGCDKQKATCTLFGNILNFKGMPFIPSPEQAV